MQPLDVVAQRPEISKYSDKFQTSVEKLQIIMLKYVFAGFSINIIEIVAMDVVGKQVRICVRREATKG